MKNLVQNIFVCSTVFFLFFLQNIDKFARLSSYTYLPEDPKVRIEIWITKEFCESQGPSFKEEEKTIYQRNVLLLSVV